MRRLAAKPLFAAAAVALLVAGCATPGPSLTPPPSPIGSDAPFAIDGRLSARHGRDAIAVAFSWTHAPPKDELVVSTPLGQSIAELAGDASAKRVELRAADGRVEVASDWGALTERAVGVALPVEDLAAWTRGAPRVNAPHSIDVDAIGRTSVLRQDGCEIVYAYADDSTRRPSTIRVACHDLDMRIAIDRWGDP
jgi:outer membrane lipoprotein LolB